MRVMNRDMSKHLPDEATWRHRELCKERVGEKLDSIIRELQFIRRDLPEEMSEDFISFPVLVCQYLRLEMMIERINGGPLERITEEPDLFSELGELRDCDEEDLGDGGKES